MPRNLSRVFAVCLTSFCLASCAATTGGSYPDDCGNYPCNSVAPYKNCHTTCNSGAEATTSGCMTTSCCAALYHYRCCDNRNYWIE